MYAHALGGGLGVSGMRGGRGRGFAEAELRGPGAQEGG